MTFLLDLLLLCLWAAAVVAAGGGVLGLGLALTWVGAGVIAWEKTRELRAEVLD